MASRYVLDTSTENAHRAAVMSDFTDLDVVDTSDADQVVLSGG